MDRYVAQVSLFSPNVSPHSVLDVHTQFDKSGSVSSPLSPIPPYNCKTLTCHPHFHRCKKSQHLRQRYTMPQIAAAGRSVAATNRLLCTAAATRLYAFILSLRHVARIQTSLNSCVRSQGQNSASATMIFTSYTSASRPLIHQPHSLPLISLIKRSNFTLPSPTPIL